MTITALLAGLVLLFCGCATVPKETDLKESLRAAAEKYWKLRMEDRYEETYKMEFGKGLPSFDQYRPLAMGMKKISITSISVKDVSVDGDKGDVDLDWNYTLPKITKPFKQIVKDRWIYQNGEWRHLTYPGAE